MRCCLAINWLHSQAACAEDVTDRTCHSLMQIDTFQAVHHLFFFFEFLMLKYPPPFVIATPKYGINAVPTPTVA